MRYLIITCLLLVVGVSAPATDFYPQKKAISHIQKSLKTKEIEIMEFTNLSSDDKNLVVYHFNFDSKPEKYYAIFTESTGRYDQFDYLLITDKTVSIQLVRILKYRSEHGSEIASKKWLSQFENYAGGDLRYGDDISAISGATISAKSIVSDIPKIIQTLKTKLK